MDEDILRDRSSLEDTNSTQELITPVGNPIIREEGKASFL
jgi:hypothetical protein